MKPLIFGGGQQRGMRSGTDNVPGAAGLAQAVSETFAHFEDDTAHFYAIKDRMIDGLEQLKDPATGEAWAIVHSMRDVGSAPHIVSASSNRCRFFPLIAISPYLIRNVLNILPPVIFDLLPNLIL